MAAQKYNLVIEQGSTFVKKITLKDGVTRLPRDISGWSGRAMIRGTYEDITPTAVFAVVTDGPNGSITLNLSSTITAALDFETAVYDVELVQDGTSPEYVERILQGNIVLSKEVTK